VLGRCSVYVEGLGVGVGALQLIGLTTPLNTVLIVMYIFDRKGEDMRCIGRMSLYHM
jgi:hypothetical protein